MPTKLDLVQLGIHEAIRQVKMTIEDLETWNKEGQSNESLHVEGVLRIIYENLDKSFDKIGVDAALSHYRCCKGNCHCKSFHRTDIAHNHCLCGHSQIDHAERVDS